MEWRAYEGALRHGDQELAHLRRRARADRFEVLRDGVRLARPHLHTRTARTNAAHVHRAHHTSPTAPSPTKTTAKTTT